MTKEEAIKFVEKVANTQEADGWSVTADKLRLALSVLAPEPSTTMHWLPMTPDAVLEGQAIYLLRDKHDGSVGLAEWMGRVHGFAMSIDYIENREHFTHYARITDPTNHFPQSERAIGSTP